MITSNASKNNYLFLLIIFTSFLACKKKDNKDAQPEVSINGHNYQTVKIGNQLWTNVNYNGAGGINYENEGNNPAHGKFYTRQEAESIVLPEGWRLPSRSDFEKMVKQFPHKTSDQNTELLPDGVLQLISTSGWSYRNGSNSSGFDARATGFVYIDAGNNHHFRQRGTTAYFISSTTELVSNGGTERPESWILGLNIEASSNPEGSIYINGGVGEFLNSDWYRYSVRFVKDIN